MEEKVMLSDGVEVTTSSPNDERLEKRWGYIAAYPHEYLIHFRKGQLNEKNSGQGASCFKWPRDTVFIIPTSLKEIVFQANQLSADNVDIRLRGMAIYHINNPAQIYTMLNFSNRQKAEEKLARMIGDLCRSTSKWLVANMGIEECMRKRKEDIAEALKNEVSRIVGDKEKGWGVEIVTIDIQDVYIQDIEIFSAMQMLFKTEKIRESQLIQLEMRQNLELKKMEQEREMAEYRKNNELEEAKINAEIKNKQIKLDQGNDEQQFALDRYRVEQNESLSQYKLTQELERERQKMLLKSEAAQQEMEKQKAVHQLEINVLQQKIEVENTATPVSLEKNFIEKALPTIADALAKSMSNSHFNVIQQEGNNSGTPFKFMLVELMDILRDRVDKLGNSSD
ncbi:SPFH domain-containing protein [Candidatus Parabeggiatoa sp. HSG14]|uniref:SPFH domain-containing protein n=1 Tax=Candidatus Parabeggiatoa sp. HSG14 TaxID=3055593 RepID=UPI0025A7A9F7|nr:SPFH domain-containing protein [Thiotrichales bacterium HSG14]